MAETPYGMLIQSRCVYNDDGSPYIEIKSDRFKSIVRIDYDTQQNALKQITAWLEGKGYTLLARADTNAAYLHICTPCKPMT